MKIKDVMTEDVLTVPTSKTLKETAQILADTGISGMPVVDDDGKVVGVISEADILFKERSPERRRGGSFAWLFFPDMLENEAKLDARTAGEAMSSPAVTIGPEPPGRRGGRPDARRERQPAPGRRRRRQADRDRHPRRSRSRLHALGRRDRERDPQGADQPHVLARARPISRSGCAHGEVTIAGEVDTKSDAELLPELIGQVPGVVSVDAKLTWKVAANSPLALAFPECTPSGSGRCRNGSSPPAAATRSCTPRRGSSSASTCSSRRSPTASSRTTTTRSTSSSQGQGILDVEGQAVAGEGGRRRLRRGGRRPPLLGLRAAQRARDLREDRRPRRCRRRARRAAPRSRPRTPGPLTEET